MTTADSTPGRLNIAATPDSRLGYEGLLLKGYSPAQAYQHVLASSVSDEVQAIIADLRTTPEGRAALDHSRRQWARRGFPPPWDLHKATP